MKILLLYQRRWFLIYLPLLLLLCTAVVAILWVWKPLPPQRVVIGTGPGQSSYLELARNYAARLEHLGIQADIVAHDRQQEALDRMASGGRGIDVTFAQGLYAAQGPRGTGSGRGGSRNRVGVCARGHRQPRPAAGRARGGLGRRLVQPHRGRRCCATPGWPRTRWRSRTTSATANASHTGSGCPDRDVPDSLGPLPGATSNVADRSAS